MHTELSSVTLSVHNLTENIGFRITDSHKYQDRKKEKKHILSVLHIKNPYLGVWLKMVTNTNTFKSYINYKIF